MKPEEILKTIARKIYEKKGEDLIIIDVRERFPFADYFIIASGTSERHINSLCLFIQEELSSGGKEPEGIEGYPESKWVLMDYGEVILHLFLPEVRRFYDLEGLWIDMPFLKYNPDEDEIVELRKVRKK
jgi:ribosome-associated protein